MHSASSTESPNAIWQQLTRYGMLGVATNLLAYALYLALTWLNVDPRAAAAVCYASAVLVSYQGNRHLVFRRVTVAGSRTLFRFLLAHSMGFTLNLLILHVFSAHLGLPHQLVQACSIVAVAIFLFIVFRLYVFQQR